VLDQPLALLVISSIPVADQAHDQDLDRALAESLARGQAVADGRVLSGPGTGGRLLVWPAGQTRGDLGQPRLNQRAALYAEALLEKIETGKPPPSGPKSFAALGGNSEVLFEFHRGHRGPGEPSS
jgi:hypothetical protein